MTLQPTNTKMELAELLVGMHNNVVETLGQKRTLVLDQCVTMERPPVLKNSHRPFEGIRYLFPVNNEMFTANEACQILSLIDAKV